MVGSVPDQATANDPHYFPVPQIPVSFVFLQISSFHLLQAFFWCPRLLKNTLCGWCSPHSPGATFGWICWIHLMGSSCWDQQPSPLMWLVISDRWQQAQRKHLGNLGSETGSPWKWCWERPWKWSAATHDIYKLFWLSCHFLSLDRILKPPKGTGFWDSDMIPACICSNHQ